MPLSQFKTLVKVQRENGIRFSLIGHNNGKTAQEFISYITEAITEKVAIILASAHFMSILADGSQARKTGSNKEMVLVRTLRNGNS